MASDRRWRPGAQWPLLLVVVDLVLIAANGSMRPPAPHADQQLVVDFRSAPPTARNAAGPWQVAANLTLILGQPPIIGRTGRNVGR